jgi:hypothetical protein
MRVEWAAICRDISEGPTGTMDLFGVGNQLSKPLALPHEVELPVAVSLVGVTIEVEAQKFTCQVSDPGGSVIGRTVFDVTAHVSDDGPAGVPNEVEVRKLEPLRLGWMATTEGNYRLDFWADSQDDPVEVWFYVVSRPDY